MNDHFKLTQNAIEMRARAAALLTAYKNTLANAEALEVVVCNGNDDEVKEAVKLSSMLLRRPRF